MNGTQRIEKALVAKGYPLAHVAIEWEPVQYYDSGREGGWEIRFDDENLDLDLNTWGKEVPLPQPGSHDVYEVDLGEIRAYSLRVVLALIGQLHPYVGVA